MSIFDSPSRNFDPLYQKQQATKDKLNTIANAADTIFPGKGDQFRDLANGLMFYDTAVVNIFNPDNPCSAFGFIEAAGDLFGFNPEVFDYYTKTREALDQMYDVAYTIPVAIMTEIDDILDVVATTSEEIDDIYQKSEDKVTEGVTRVNNAINVFNTIRDRIDTDKKKLIFILAALSLPIEDVQMFLEKSKFFEMTMLEPCQNYYKAKILGEFRDEYGLVDVEAIFKQKDKLTKYMLELPDSIF